MRFRSMRAVALAVAVFALVSACGPVKRVNPPAAIVQRLVLAGEVATIDLRLQNHSDVETRFGALDLSIAIEGQGIGRVDRAAGVTAAPHSVEVVSVELAVDPAAKNAIDAALASGKSIRYRIDGRIATEEPDGRYDIEYESRLSPVPGRPGEFR